MWAHIVNAVLGIWLMAAPAVLSYESPARTNDRILGPVIATFAIVAWWEATRAVGRWNTVLGAWMLLAPWVLGYTETYVIVHSMAIGVLVLGLAFVRGAVDQTFGGGWSALWADEPEHERIAQRQGRA